MVAEPSISYLGGIGRRPYPVRSEKAVLHERAYPMLRMIIISTSLSPGSKSRILAYEAQSYLVTRGMEVRFIDMKEQALPDFDHNTCYEHESVSHLTNQLAWAQGIVLSTPVYNWNSSGVLKKVIENTGTNDTGRKCRAWEDKVVTFLCSGGIPQSYMAYLSFANSLMLDYKCIINPHFVFAVEDDFSEEGIENEKIEARLKRVMDIAIELTDRLKDRKLLSGWCI